MFTPATPQAEAIRSLTMLVFAITGLNIPGCRRDPDLLPRQVPAGGCDRDRGAAAGLREQADRDRLDGCAGTHRLRAGPGHDSHSLGSERPPPVPRPGDKSLFVTVVGRQWWWEYRYDSYDGKADRLHHRQ